MVLNCILTWSFLLSTRFVVGATQRRSNTCQKFSPLLRYICPGKQQLECLSANEAGGHARMYSFELGEKEAGHCWPFHTIGEEGSNYEIPPERLNSVLTATDTGCFRIAERLQRWFQNSTLLSLLIQSEPTHLIIDDYGEPPKCKKRSASPSAWKTEG